MRPTVRALLPKLTDAGLFRQAAFVNGKWVSARNNIEVTNPADGSRLGEVPNLGTEETRDAILAAAHAFPGFSGLLAKERARLLARWAELVREHRQDLATLMTLEQGKPLAEALGEVEYAASFLTWFSEEAKRVYGKTIPAAKAGSRAVVIRQPVGVCGLITPWNFPLAMITRKAGAALAVGCTTVVKPSEFTPFSALALAELAERAGIPAGVYNVVTGDAAPIGQELTANEKVAKISFTGSTRVGKLLLAQAAGTVKRVSMELGGNAPFIVFDDADIDQAIEGLLVAKFRNAGQTCVCANRIYVHTAIYDEFAAKLADRVKGLVVGSGLQQGVTQGPLINDAALEKVQGLVDDAISKGARALVGGRRHELGRTFFEPTVLVDLSLTSRVAKEEAFGPIAPLFRFTHEDDLIRMANDTEYGLAAYFYTQNIGRAWRVAEALQYGMVGVNEGHISAETTPFGGVKQSGLGREGSSFGVDDYLNIKYVLMGGLGKI